MQISIDMLSQAFESPNVIAILEGSDPILKNEYVVLSAHLDHLGTIQGEVYNGANDDATGSAVVLELAQVLAAHPPRRSVIFALFTCEEQSHCGTDYFLAQPPVPVKSIVANINLEVLGGVNPDVSGIIVMATPQLLETASRLSIPGSVPLKTFEAEPVMDDYQKGDHLSFYQHGIPAAMVASGASDEYHTPQDDIGRINFDHLYRLSQYILSFVQEVANQEARTIRP